MRNGCVALLLAAVCIGAGCSSIGPGSVERDRFDYNTAIANSWKEQTLLNIVKLRYADMPLFVEVASIVAGYTMESQVSGGAVFPSRSGLGGDTFSVGASGKFTDRPTITYAPITGQQFNKSFMTPVPPAAVIFLLQTGWQAELVFPMTVDSMNGLRSRIAGGMSMREGDGGYYEAVERLGRVQRSGVIGMQVLREDETETAMMVIRRENIAPEIQADLEALSELLNLTPGEDELNVVYRAVQKDGTELAMLTRSMLHIMIQMATQVDVPEEDVTEGRTVPSLPSGVSGGRDLVDIRWSDERPADAFVAVRYRGHWFYIEDADFASKRSFAFLMLLFSLSETGGREGLPLVTIPAG